jgi:DNA-binding beta-propeller fold protein YncE
VRRLALVIALSVVVLIAPEANAGSVQNTWPALSNPYGIVVDSSDGRVYVANTASSRAYPTGISVIDPAAGNETTLLTALPPNLLAVDPAGRRLYASESTYDASQRSFEVFDLTSMRSLGALPVGGLGIAIDPTAGRAYVAGATYLAMIDTTTLSVISTKAAPASQRWFGAATDVARHRVYVTNLDQYHPTLEVFDSTDLSLISEISLPKMVRFAIVVDPGSGVVYLGSEDPNGYPNEQSELIAVDPDSLAVTATVPVGQLSGGVALAPARHAIYVTDAFSRKFYEIDSMSLTVTQTYWLTGYPSQIAMHPDGRLYIVFPAFAAYCCGSVGAFTFDNSAPVVWGLSFDPAAPVTNSLVQVRAQHSDPDWLPWSGTPDPTLIAYQWSLNGNPIAGATQPTIDLSVPGHGDRGDTISVRITATDPQGASDSEIGSFIIGNAAPTVSMNLSNTAPHTNDVITAAATASDADGDAVALSYQWLRNGTPVAGATGTSFDLSVIGDRGDTITAEVTGSDGHGGVTVASVDAVVADTPPTLFRVDVSTTSPRTNDILVITPVATDLDGDVLYYRYTVKVNGIERICCAGGVPVLMNLAYPGWGDRGDRIDIEAQAGDGMLGSNVLTLSLVVADSPPDVAVGLNTATPAPKDVLVATASASDADGDPISPFTYTWRVGKKVVRTTTSATTDSLNLAGIANNGDVVTVIVTASDGSATGSSQATATVTASPKR